MRRKVAVAYVLHEKDLTSLHKNSEDSELGDLCISWLTSGEAKGTPVLQ